ncbi:hypothetical protein GCM10009634_60740 [Saccharothrix xinjiangensis]
MAVEFRTVAREPRNRNPGSATSVPRGREWLSRGPGLLDQFTPQVNRTTPSSCDVVPCTGCRLRPCAACPRPPRRIRAAHPRRPGPGPTAIERTGPSTHSTAPVSSDNASALIN